MSSKEESSDNGYLARDSLEVPALGERDRCVCVLYELAESETRGKGCIALLTGGMCRGKSTVQTRNSAHESLEVIRER